MAALGALVTLIGAYYALFPPVSFEIGDIDSADPFTTYFSVSNDGPFAIHDLRVGCSHLLLHYVNGISLHGNPKLFITKESNYLRELPGHQTRSFQCPRFVGASNGASLVPIEHMDIALTAKYSGPIRAMQRRQTRPFETETRKDGRMRWIPLSVPEANRLKSYDLFPWGNEEVEFVASEGQPSPPK
jgi:hypothetical protein